MSASAQTPILPGVLAAAEDFVRRELAAMDASHDFAHIQRVRANAAHLAQLEGLGPEAASLVDLAALLHDVRDWKYSGSDEATGQAVADFLTVQGLDSETTAQVLHIISRVGFKEELGAATAAGRAAPPALSVEAAIVQDADRLDAIGAIGIARCFTFGGARHRLLHDPAMAPRDGLTKEQYMYAGPAAAAGGAGAAAAALGPVAQQQPQHQTTINHFYEKLLKLKGLMKTASGFKIAEGRHAFMEQFLHQFHEEWAGRA